MRQAPRMHRGGDLLKRDALHYKAEHQAPLPKDNGTPAHLKYATDELKRIDSNKNQLQQLQEQAQYMQRLGEGDDSILAHISPEEAEELELEHGGDINPYTGLPQFGFWQNLRKGNFWKNALPIGGAILGNMLIPGAGALLGGALGGAATHRNIGTGALRGLGTGALTGLGASALGSSGLLGGSLAKMAPVAGTTGMLGPVGGPMGALFSPIGKIMGGAGQLIGGPLGAIGGPIVSGFQGGYRGPQQVAQQAPQQMLPQVAQGMAGAAPAAQVAAQQAAQAPQGIGGQFLSGIGSGIGSLMGGIMQNPLSSALGGLGIYGALREGRSARRHAKTEHERMLAHNPYAHGHRPPEEYQETIRVRPKRRRVLRPGDVGYDPSSKYYEDVHATEYYAKGGYVDGDSGGQDDDVSATLHPGDYIIDATTVSLSGDGNSKSGNKRFEEFEKKSVRRFHDKFSKGAIVRDYPKSEGHRVIDAKLSSGERRIPAPIVTAIGKGSNKKGAKVLDAMRKNIRRHKGVSKFLPPKSKKLESYIR